MNPMNPDRDFTNYEPETTPLDKDISLDSKTDEIVWKILADLYEKATYSAYDKRSNKPSEDVDQALKRIKGLILSERSEADR
jgi:hypothetical protein